MKVINKIDIHLDDYQIIPEIVVMQCDVNSRVLELSLYSGGEPWNLPSGAKLYVSYRKPDGTGGFYDTLHDRTAALSLNGNTITAIMAQQVLTVPGKVQVSVSAQASSCTIATFSVQLNVKPNPGIGAVESEDYFCLSAAINAAVAAAQEPVRIIEVSGSDGNYTSSHNLNQIITLIVNKIPILCYWKERQIVMHLASYVINNFVWFSNIIDSIEYNVFIDESGVGLNELPIALISNIPSRVSELENDSGYLTEAPVIEVNGKTGKVELPTPLRVTLNAKEDGTYEPSMYSQPIFNSVHGLGCVVFCQYGSQIIPLVYATSAKCIFQIVINNEITTVTIAGFSATVVTTPLASGGGGVIITDDGQGNVTITSAPATSATDETGE